MTKKFKEAIRGFFNAAGVYLLTCLGILTRMYLPWAIAVGEGAESGLPEASSVVFIAKIIAALILGVSVAARDEATGDPVGRDQALGRRLRNAFTAGLGWYALVEMF